MFVWANRRRDMSEQPKKVCQWAGCKGGVPIRGTKYCHFCLNKALYAMRVQQYGRPAKRKEDER